MTDAPSNRQSVDLSDKWASISAGPEPEPHISQSTSSQQSKVTSLTPIIMATSPQSSHPDDNSSTTHTYKVHDIHADVLATIKETIENAGDPAQPLIHADTKATIEETSEDAGDTEDQLLLRAQIEEFGSENMRGEVSVDQPLEGGTVEVRSLKDLKDIHNKKLDEAQEKKDQRLGRLKTYTIAKLVLSAGVTLLGAAIILGGIASMNPAVLLVSLGIGAALMAGGAYYTGKNLRELQGFKGDPNASFRPEDYKRFDEKTGKGDRKLDNTMKDIEIYEKFSKKFTPEGELDEFYKNLEGTTLTINADNYREFASVYDEVQDYIKGQREKLKQVNTKIANSAQDPDALARLQQEKQVLERSLEKQALAKLTQDKMTALQKPEEGSEPLLHRGIDFVADRMIQPLKNKLISSLIGNPQIPNEVEEEEEEENLSQNPVPADGGPPPVGTPPNQTVPPPIPGQPQQPA